MSTAFSFAIVAACTSSSGSDAGVIPASCTISGMATMGPADMHCGTMIQHVDPASCHIVAGAGDDGGGSDGPGEFGGVSDGGSGMDSGTANPCPYGDTMYGMESNDDDCKYHVTWTASPICEGPDGVTFKVVVTTKDGSQAVAGAQTRAEVFMSSAADAGCDIFSKHAGPNSGMVLQEAPPGTYTGQVIFDSPGLWTVRFHFHEDCDDSPSSPHGHAAYFVTVP